MGLHWWVFAILVLNIVRYPSLEYYSSYMQTFSPIGVALAIAALLFFIEGQVTSWKNWNIILKFFYIMLWYSASMGISFYVAVYLIGPKGYFGSDPEGNIAMGYLPSIVMNIIIALGVGIVWSIYRSVKSNQAL